MNNNFYVYGDNKFKNFKTKIKQGFDNGKDWIINNKEFITVSIGVVIPILNVVSKHMIVNKNNKMKNLYCYDRSLGHYWQLKRKLSSKEWMNVTNRKKSGESLANILASMNVLK